MYEYEVHFVYDYATIIVSNNLAKDYDHAIQEARYWMESSGISAEYDPVSVEVERIVKDGEEV